MEMQHVQDLESQGKAVRGHAPPEDTPRDGNRRPWSRRGIPSETGDDPRAEIRIDDPARPGEGPPPRRGRPAGRKNERGQRASRRPKELAEPESACHGPVREMVFNRLSSLLLADGISSISKRASA